MPVPAPPIRRGFTSFLFLGASLCFGASLTSYLLGTIGLANHLLASVPALYLVAICTHDSIHFAASPDRRVNAVVGWVSTALLGAAYPVYRKAHLLHHGLADKPGDPELFAQGPWWQLPFRWFFGNVSFYGVVPKLSRRERALAAGYVVVAAALVAAAPAAVGLGWLLPMQLALCAFTINTVWVPHGPLQAVVRENLPVFTGYHDDHHARPAYPFHQYPELHVWRRDGVASAAPVAALS